MTAIALAAYDIAAVLAREGLDYTQSKVVFKAAQVRAGLLAAPKRSGSIARRMVEELDSLDHACARSSRSRLMFRTLLQLLLETRAQTSELVQLKVEDVSLAEHLITMPPRKGGKRRVVPIRRDLAQLLRRHIGARQVGPLFASRRQGSGIVPYSFPHHVGQVVREVTRASRTTGSVSV